MIDGVRKINSDEWSVYFIDNLSDALKTVIRERLSSICYGSINANRGWEIYSYKATVKEFVHRYPDAANLLIMATKIIKEEAHYVSWICQGQYSRSEFGTANRSTSVCRCGQT